MEKTTFEKVKKNMQKLVINRYDELSDLKDDIICAYEDYSEIDERRNNEEITYVRVYEDQTFENTWWASLDMTKTSLFRIEFKQQKNGRYKVVDVLCYER